MIVGVPREVKDLENRVSTTPAGAREYVAHGHTVLVETTAGIGSGFADAEYAAAGAEIVSTHEEVFARAGMIVKVKEPVAAEYPFLRENQLLFTYLHLANDEPLTRALIEQRVQAVAYETVQLACWSTPAFATDERSCGPDVGPGWGPLPGTDQWRTWHAARRCTGGPWRRCRDHRWWYRRHQCGADRARYGRQRNDPRHERRSLAIPRPNPAWTHSHTGIQ